MVIQNIYETNQQMRYVLRPETLENVCLTVFMSKYRMYYGERKMRQPQNPLESSDRESDSEESSGNLFKLKDGSQVQKLKNPGSYRIIRSVGFGILKEREAYFREQLLLYCPYRSEEDCALLNGCTTFEERYNKVKTIVENNRKDFEPFRHEIEKAQIFLNELPNNLELENVAAPNLRCLDDFDACQDLDQGRKVISHLKDLPNFTVENLPCFMEEKFLELVALLNAEQKSFLLEILNYERKRLAKCSVEKMYPFLSGGAGTGKTLLVKCLYQCLLRLFKSTEIEPQKLTVCIGAFTAAAARNVGGETLHSLLAIPPDSERALAMSFETESRLRQQYSQLKVLIIDETSLVGNYFVHIIDQRLRKIKNCDEPFGGVTVECVGDLFQLPPVKDSYIFSRSSRIKDVPINDNLWSRFRMHELTKIMRQNEQDWCQLLNRLREGNLTDCDWDVLNSLKNNQIPECSLRICAIRKNVEAYNAEVVCCFPDQKFEAIATDRVKDHALDEKSYQSILMRLKSLPSCETGGLHYCLNLVLNQPYMLTVNVSKEDSIINGMLGYLRKIEFSNCLPCTLFVEFPNDESIGVYRKRFYQTRYPNETGNNWVPIKRVVQQFLVPKSK